MSTSPTLLDGYPVVCHKSDHSAINYKLNGIPQTMRSDVASQYSTIYQGAIKAYTQEATDNGTHPENPVINKLAQDHARKHANAYLSNVVKMVKGYASTGDFVDSKDRFRLEFLMLWEQHAPDAELLDTEQRGELDSDTAKALKRQRRERWQAVRAFCNKEAVTFPSSGSQDSSTGNGAKFNRLVNRDWITKQFSKRSKKGEQHRARCACRIGKHADQAITEEALQDWLQSQRDSIQYMQDTVFISTEDDEVDMMTVYNSSNANPKNRKTKVITLLTGLVNFAEDNGYQFVMITPTAASEHHPAPRQNASGEWALNPKFNTKWQVKYTHNHLNEIFKRVASALDREGVDFFALKGVEAHKDGTPHHHYGFFYKGATLKQIKDIFNWYYREYDQIVKDFHQKGDHKQRNKITLQQGLILRQHLKDTQPGALTRRVNYKVFDPKGDATLTTYIIKDVLGYVVKDVREEGDTDTPETKEQKAKREKQERGAAWASLHGINQFSLIRINASIGIWDELRRIHEPVAGSTQLEAERLACCGTFGTEAHDNPDTRQNPDFCRFMELRRNPVDDCEPVNLTTENEYESDGETLALGSFGDTLERVTGVESKSEGLTVETRPIRWRAVNVPTLLDAMVKHESPPMEPGQFNPDTTDELRALYADLLETARKEKTLHQFGRAVYNWPESPRVGESFEDRARPGVTWEIRNNRTKSPPGDESPGLTEKIPINPEIDLNRAADSDLKQNLPTITGNPASVETLQGVFA